MVRNKKRTNYKKIFVKKFFVINIDNKRLL